MFDSVYEILDLLQSKRSWLGKRLEVLEEFILRTDIPYWRLSMAIEIRAEIKAKLEMLNELEENIKNGVFDESSRIENLKNLGLVIQ